MTATTIYRAPIKPTPAWPVLDPDGADALGPVDPERTAARLPVVLYLKLLQRAWSA